MKLSASRWLLSTLCVLVLAAPAVAMDEAGKPSLRAQQDRGNICFGGFEHGKLIPADDQIDNPFTQTSLIGCAIEGGKATFLPDLKPKVAGGLMS